MTMTRREWVFGFTSLGVAASLRAAEAALDVDALDHVNIHVPDVKASAEFYTKLFGTVVSRTASAPVKPGSGRSEIWFLRMGANMLAISSAGKEKPGIDHFCFGIPHYDGAAVRKRVAGLNEMTPDAAPSNLWLKDPDGYVVQLNGGDKSDVPGSSVGAVLVELPGGVPREPAFKVKSIAALILPVADRKASTDYYRKALGDAAEMQGAFRVGLSQLIFEPANQPMRLRFAIDGFNPAAAMAKLKSLGIIGAKRQKTTVSFSDPDGLGIELIPAIP